MYESNKETDAGNQVVSGVTYKTRAERRDALRSKGATVLTPAVRRWAYGVAAAALGVAVFAGWVPPGAAPVVVPLLLALFYVDENGEPKS